MSHKKQFLLPGIFIFCFIFLSTLPVSEAQKKSKKITYDQVYSNAEPRLLKSLPSIREWLDDAHYLVVEEDETDDSQKWFKVNAVKNTKALFLDYGQIQKSYPKVSEPPNMSTTPKTMPGFFTQIRAISISIRA